MTEFFMPKQHKTKINNCHKLKINKHRCNDCLDVVRAGYIRVV